ncbi:MAG: class I SAM-dependent methyltransferase [Planctomycetota bacterium]
MKTRESGMPPEEMWQSFFDPNGVLTKLGLDSNCGDVLEFGCGYGTFTIPAAQRIRGTVYAIDIEPEMLAITGAKAKAVGAENIELLQRDFVVDGSGLADRTVDYVMLFNILHAQERMALLREARRVLRPHGKLAIIHWNFDASTPRGPSMSIRPKPGQCRAWAEEVGFAAISPADIDLPPYHYGLVLEPCRCD